MSTPAKDTKADSVSAAQADVDRIRDELAGTVDALVAKTDVAARAKDAGSRLGAKVGDAASQARDTAASLTSDGQDRVQAVGEQVHDRFSSARDDVRANGIPSRLRSRESIVALAAVTVVAVGVVIAVLRRRG